MRNICFNHLPGQIKVILGNMFDNDKLETVQSMAMFNNTHADGVIRPTVSVMFNDTDGEIFRWVPNKDMMSQQYACHWIRVDPNAQKQAA